MAGGTHPRGSRPDGDAGDEEEVGDAEGGPRKGPGALHVVPAGPPPDETAKPHGEGPPAAITLGCKSCGTVMVVAHPSVDVVCICSKCKRPFDVIRECRACGSRFALTQDEYHACSPAGRRCPVCMEPDV